ncbi:hypothetical protein GCM10025859_57230 [Alicyclobacillus fastidiosus]|nr:hypothetical protein GCM10025859_57230 [Alicyclobacillus fastidiosus]
MDPEPDSRMCLSSNDFYYEVGADQSTTDKGGQFPWVLQWKRKHNIRQFLIRLMLGISKVPSAPFV